MDTKRSVTARKANDGTILKIPSGTSEKPFIGISLILRRVVMELISELWAFMRVRKKFWLMPVFLLMLFFGTMLVLAKGSAVAPFIYTLF